jgi:hypothetical protein
MALPMPSLPRQTGMPSRSMLSMGPRRRRCSCCCAAGGSPTFPSRAAVPSRCASMWMAWATMLLGAEDAQRRQPVDDARPYLSRESYSSARARRRGCGSRCSGLWPRHAPLQRPVAERQRGVQAERRRPAGRCRARPRVEEAHVLAMPAAPRPGRCGRSLHSTGRRARRPIPQRRRSGRASCRWRWGWRGGR